MGTRFSRVREPNGGNYFEAADASTCKLFFSFQAEDGIRDIGMTGVQTCALPISPKIGFSHFLIGVKRENPIFGAQFERVIFLSGITAPWFRNHTRAVFFGDLAGAVGGTGVRSEERRVGKGCTSRGSLFK